LFFVTATFAAIDWVRSLDPTFHSTTFGLYFVAGQGASGLAMAVVVLASASERDRDLLRIDTSSLHDLAKLLFTFVILWAYIAFTQFFIIWNGNLPEESAWYVRRAAGPFSALAIALILFHFAVPLLVLLLRATNERAGTLIPIALLLLAMRAVDIYWLIAPERASLALTAAWAGLASIVGIGGLWMAWTLRTFDRRARGMP
jgi:hypothetical protein